MNQHYLNSLSLSLSLHNIHEGVGTTGLSFESRAADRKWDDMVGLHYVMR
jgi:hypothetical protein